MTCGWTLSLAIFVAAVRRRSCNRHPETPLFRSSATFQLVVFRLCRFGFLPGKTNVSLMRGTVLRISRAALLSGTSCARFDLFRWPGSDHSASSQPISDHLKPRDASRTCRHRPVDTPPASDLAAQALEAWPN